MEKATYFEKVPVNTPGGGYDVCVGRNTLEVTLPPLLASLMPNSVAVISHPGLLELYGERLRFLIEASFAGNVRTLFYSFPDGEEHKDLETLKEAYGALLRFGITRYDVLLAFGGGVVGDLAGFVAATYMRGLRYLQVPTTLMAMVDSSIGGKVGIDLPEGKNLVGAFYQPEAVLVDVDYLATLPAREMRSGLAEVAKYGFLYDEGILVEMERWQDGLPDEDYDFVPLVMACARQKASVVSEDERDLSGRRARLNYGHTFGHALEAATGYRALRHGEAVALGMIMAARMAELFWSFATGFTERHLRILLPLLKEVRLPRGLTADDVMEYMERDKKKRGELSLILLMRWQAPVLVNSPPLDLVRRAVDEVLKEVCSR